MIIYTTASLLVFSCLASVVFTPILFKIQTNLRKTLTVLQQICITLYLLALIIYNISFASSDVKYFHTTFWGQGVAGSFGMKIIGQQVIQFFQSFFYYEFYFISIMNSFDIYMMTCHPLDYSEFKQWRKYVKYLVYGSLVCLCFSIDHLFYIVAAIALTFSKTRVMHYVPVSDKLDKFSLVKMIILKIVYTCLNLKMIIATRKALKTSLQMTQKSDKQELHRRLVVFLIIPLCLSVVYVIPEVFDAVYPQPSHATVECSYPVRFEVRYCITAGVVTLGSLAYFVGYFILSQKVRQIIMCKR